MNTNRLAVASSVGALLALAACSDSSTAPAARSLSGPKALHLRGALEHHVGFVHFAAHLRGGDFDLELDEDRGKLFDVDLHGSRGAA